LIDRAKVRQDRSEPPKEGGEKRITDPLDLSVIRPYICYITNQYTDMNNSPVNEQIRCDALGELLENMVADSSEHGLTVSDILISFMNNVMLQEERDKILAGIQKG
jgi:hypothetical protein